MLKFGEANTT